MKCIYLILVCLLFFVSSYSQFIATLYPIGGAEPSQLLTDLFVYYPLDESSGNFIDAHGSRDLTASGTLTYSVGGKVGTCITFITDGQGKYIANDFEFAGSYSISCWVKTAATGAYRGIVTYYGSAARGWALRMNNGGANNGIAMGQRWWNGGNVLSYGWVDPINEDAWNHVVVTYNIGTDDQKVYINNVLRDTDTDVNGNDYETDCDFEIGSTDDGEFWDGEIDEVGVWDGRVLSTDDIGYLYNSGSGLAYPLDY